ncbi:MAG: hypothetical protein V3W45_03130 [Sedimentisphaerales bacterium]
MNRRQKAILKDFAIVIIATAIAVMAMINLKDWVNRSEAMRAMEHLRRSLQQHRDKHSSVPSQSWVDSQIKILPGHVRLGELQYRGPWISYDSTGDEVLAYTKKNYHSLLLGKGYVVLRLGAVLSDDGRVEWMEKQQFESLLAQQQSPLEIEILQK